MFFGKKDAQQMVSDELKQRGSEKISGENLINLFKSLIGQKNIEQQLQDQPGVGTEFKIKTPKEVQQIVDLERGLTSLPRAFPRTNLGTVSTEGMLSDEQKKLIGQEEKPKKKEVKEYNLSGPDYPKTDEKKILSTGDETSRYFNNPLELQEGIKNNNDRIMNYLYGGISKKEWAGQKPIFDFVAISRKDKGKPTSSAFGPVQIVGNTVRDAMTRIKKGTEEYNFANRLQAAQNLFINLANKYKAGKNFNEQTARETARTDAGKPALKTLGITEDQFIEYVKEGYFLPSNQEKSKGLPPEILGDNYKENYYKLFKNVLSNKSVGTDSLEETIKKYYGHPSEKKKTRYMKDVFKNLNILTKQSGGRIEKDPYKRQPRFI